MVVGHVQDSAFDFISAFEGNFWYRVAVITKLFHLNFQILLHGIMVLKIKRVMFWNIILIFDIGMVDITSIIILTNIL